MSESNVSRGGWFFPALFLVFLTLKLCDVIDWHWGWIAAPLWGPVVLVMLVVIIAGIIAVIAAVAGTRGRI